MVDASDQPRFEGFHGMYLEHCRTCVLLHEIAKDAFIPGFSPRHSDAWDPGVGNRCALR